MRARRAHIVQRRFVDDIVCEPRRAADQGSTGFQGPGAEPCEIVIADLRRTLPAWRAPISRTSCCVPRRYATGGSDGSRRPESWCWLLCQRAWPGISGPELRRFCAGATPSLPGLLGAAAGGTTAGIGVAISKRQMMRPLIAGQDGFLAENRDVLRAALQTAAWISADDTGARHAGKNGFCTQIGNDDFAWFGTRTSKSRLNFPICRAPGSQTMSSTKWRWTICANAPSRGLLSIGCLAHRQRRFADQAAWQTHLDRLGTSVLEGHTGSNLHRHRSSVVGQRPGTWAAARHGDCQR